MQNSSISSLVFTVAVYLGTVGGAPLAAQSTWYVDAAGVPPGSGSLQDPYTSIQFALDQPATADGDTLLVAPGTYAPFDLGSTFDLRPMTILGTGGAAVTQVAGGSAITRGAEVSGFTFSGRVDVGGRLSRCVVANVPTFGVVADAGPLIEVQIDRCTVTGCGTGVVNFAFYDVCRVTDSLVADNGLDIDFFGTMTADNTLQSLDGLATGFWDAPGGDYRLQFGSGAIDYDGSGVDVGAFDFDSNYLPTPFVYCTSKTTALGCVPKVSASGGSAASFSAPQNFTLSTQVVPEDVPGLFYFGLAPSVFPLAGSWFCIQPPTLRTPPMFSGSAGIPCSGSYAFDFNAYLQSGEAPPFVVPGQGVYAQFWFRDLADPSGSARTEAVAFGIVP